MSGNALLVARLPLPPASAPAAMLARSAPRTPTAPLRPLRNDDLDVLADLWLRAYPSEVTAGENPGSVRDDFAGTFEGDYGALVPDATLGAMDAENLTGAIMTVTRAAWSDAPDCPFVIELFVAPEARRSGLGRALLRTAAAALCAQGESRLALRVERDNHPALALYTVEGFRPA